jgi:adenylosuccinate lyase
MEITLPPHVSAAWADETALAAWLSAAATAEAERRAVDAARADAEAVLAAARAPFADGPATPTEQTLAERVEQVAARAVHLGVTLSIEAGVSPERVAEIVAEITGEAER